MIGSGAMRSWAADCERAPEKECHEPAAELEGAGEEISGVRSNAAALLATATLLPGAMRSWAGDCKPLAEPVWQSLPAELESADGCSESPILMPQKSVSEAPSSKLLKGGAGFGGYGTVEDLRTTGEAAVKFLGVWQQVLAVAVGLFVVVLLGQRALGLHSVHVPSSVSRDYRAGLAEGRGLLARLPAKDAHELANASSGPSCKDYTYPRCEAALAWYLMNGAKTRCEAFEHVKGEGDVFRYPYNSVVQAYCDASVTGAACCGCAGQCSRCPPVLPECCSWAIDGSWLVAFEDGTQGHYSFDANGHVMAELPNSAVPRVWKSLDDAYIQEGNDLAPPTWMSLKDAEARCAANPGCRGITFNEQQVKDNLYFIYLKGVSTLSPAPGTGWRAYIQDQSQTLRRRVAVSGALVKQQVWSVKVGESKQRAEAFKFGLHDAAPHLFPPGSFELISLEGRMLRVERHVGGKGVVNSGTGIMQ